MTAKANPLRPLDEILEKQWQATLFKGSGRDLGLAPMLGWQLVYHTLHSRGSHSGFPDWVLVRDRVIYAELKRERRVSSPVSSEQHRWLDGLARAGQEVYLWRPSDLDEVARILSKRWRREGYRLVSGEGSDGDPWTPSSMWVAGQGRFDEGGS